MSKHYKAAPKKDYIIWINEHRNDIIDQAPEQRVNYVLEQMNKSLEKEYDKKFVYQLLYRHGLLDKNPLRELTAGECYEKLISKDLDKPTIKQYIQGLIELL